ncbi:MAG: hypothetical protein IPO85_17495 [Saprospiraceae bacterium]|uniref:Uncharacterized protein n=1 Tax=Candidatus Defluviibacterium haderslevense TaxID=2981993 RepID=A0A9D7SCH1_9BACT|nr:hypothetical protein [Candidatus Defluviibacterium haderslevense]
MDYIYDILFFNPPLFFSVGRKTIWGDTYSFYGVGEIITEYYDDGFLYFGLAHLMFFLGYFLISYVPYQSINRVDIDSKKRIVIITLLCFIIVYINFVSSGVNPLDVLLGNSNESLFGAAGESNYFRNFADSLVTCLIICVFVKVDKRFIYLMILVSFLLFGLMGFRYRIVITFFRFYFIIFI